MRINCELEIVYSLAVAKGGISSRSSRSRAALSLGKKPVPMRSTDVSGEGSKREELYLIVSTAKNVAGTKYKVSSGKLLSLYCKAAPIYLSQWGGVTHIDSVATTTTTVSHILVNSQSMLRNTVNA